MISTDGRGLLVSMNEQWTLDRNQERKKAQFQLPKNKYLTAGYGLCVYIASLDHFEPTFDWIICVDGIGREIHYKLNIEFCRKCIVLVLDHRCSISF